MADRNDKLKDEEEEEYVSVLSVDINVTSEELRDLKRSRPIPRPAPRDGYPAFGYDSDEEV